MEGESIKSGWRMTKKDEENVQVNDKSMEFEYNYEQEAVHEHELIQSKTTFLNI